MSSNVAIVTTTINERPEDYALWAEQGRLVVAGDLNTPPSLVDYVKELGGVYLSPEEQERYAFSDVLGWRCIQRRNAAVMFAYSVGAEYVLTVDDDNKPMSSTFVEQHAAIVSGEVDITHNYDAIMARQPNGVGWVNTGDFVVPSTWQRGTPYSVKTAWKYSDRQHSYDIVVSQAQALGSPDCDAVTRIIDDPSPDAVWESVIIDPRSTCIFNSQSTMWRGEWAPLIACLPYVGRYDDVLASVIAQHIMRNRDKSVFVGSPAAWQDRNEHDLMKDLANERWGMKNIMLIKAVVDAVPVYDTDELYDAYGRIATALSDSRLMPTDTTRFMMSWANEWRKVAATRT